MITARLRLAVGLLWVDGPRFVILLDRPWARPRLLDRRKSQRLHEFHSEGHSRVQPYFVTLGQEQTTEHARADRGCAGAQHAWARSRGSACKYDCPGSRTADYATTFNVIDGHVAIVAAIDLALFVGP